MPYLPPSLPELKELAKDLLKKYKGTDLKEIKRIRLVQIIAALLDDSAESFSILLGLLVFIRDLDSYRSFNKYNLFCTDVTLSGMLTKGLGIKSSNPFEKNDKITHVAAWLHHAEKLTIDLPGYNNVAALTTDIKTQLKSVLKASQHHIDELHKERPSAEELFKQFAELPTKYNVAKKKNNGDRDDYLNYLREFWIQIQSYAQQQDETHIIAEQSIRYHACYVAMLYVMKQIESELKYKTVLSPEHSQLYKLLQLATNVNHSHDVPAIQRVHLYWILGGIIPIVDPLSYEPCSWQTAAFPQATAFFLEMNSNLLDMLQKVNEEVRDADPHPVVHKIRKGVNFGVGALSALAIGGIAGNLIEIPVGSRIVSKVLGAAGKKYYSYPGYAMGREIGTKIERGIATALVGKSMETASTTVITAPGQAVYYPLSGIAKACNAVNNLIYGPQIPNPYKNSACVNALVSLPDDVYSAENKTKLRATALYKKITTTSSSAPQDITAGSPSLNTFRR